MDDLVAVGAPKPGLHSAATVTEGARQVDLLRLRDDAIARIVGGYHVPVRYFIESVVWSVFAA